MDQMMYSKVFKSLIRRPEMNSMPTKWLCLSVIFWVFLSVFLAIEVTPYVVFPNFVGLLVTNYFLQKAYLKDKQIFSVFLKYKFQNNFYPAKSNFNYLKVKSDW